MNHARALTDALKGAGLDAFHEHSGGGCGTIYVGPTHHEEGWGDRYAALIGPFVYMTGEADDGPLIYVGPDDNGESDHLSIPPNDVATIVGACVRLAAHGVAGVTR